MPRLLFLLVLCLLSSLHAQNRKIGILIREGLRGEIVFAYRIQAACKNLGWKADVLDIDDPKFDKTKRYDFVINTVPIDFRYPKCKNYLTIFHPAHHHFDKKGFLWKHFRGYDGYLVTYSPSEYNHRGDEEKREFPYLTWYPTTQNRDYKILDPKRLFHVCCHWGNRFENPKFRECFQRLDQEPYTRFYGCLVFQSLYPESYRGDILYNDKSFYELCEKAGISLVLHSEEHNSHGLPSGRIFEAVASSTVVICDQNPFVQKHFGDAVLYIDTNTDGKSIYEQIHKHVLWIQEHKQEALKKAKKAHEIYRKHFSLEQQLLQLERFHLEQLKKPNNRFLRWLKTIKDRTLAYLFPYSLINSVDFHPKKNLVCATHTQSNKVVISQVDSKGHLKTVQTLCNPEAQFSEPQHAVFSPEGDKLAVINWTDQSFNIYQSDKTGKWIEKPIASVPPPDQLASHKPHGMAFSPDGKFLAVAYGFCQPHARAVALFEVSDNGTKYQLTGLLSGAEQLPGIPKGIVFSPDGRCLLVTFSDCNTLALFDLHEGHILANPRQIVRGPDTQISRPEDVKISTDGRFCAISNSDRHSITFYRFDPTLNQITQNQPMYTLQADLCFPHGIAFSPDGAFLATTEFGPLQSTEEGNIIWDEKIMNASHAKVRIHSLCKAAF